MRDKRDNHSIFYRILQGIGFIIVLLWKVAHLA